MWEHTPSTKDKPLYAGMMMEDGDSPGCPNRLNNAPALRVSHRGCRRQTLHPVLETGSGIKNEPFWTLLNATLSPIHSSIPPRFSQVQLQISLGQLSAPGQMYKLDPLLLYLCWDTCFYLLHGFSVISYSLLTSSFQAGVLSALMIAPTCTKPESILGIQFGNSTSFLDIHRWQRRHRLEAEDHQFLSDFCLSWLYRLPWIKATVGIC